MLEAPGTREGRAALLDALAGAPVGPGLRRRGLWEVVREKSGVGRLWLRWVFFREWCWGRRGADDLRFLSFVDRLIAPNVDGYIDTLVHPPEPLSRAPSPRADAGGVRFAES